jgi:zinc protease
MVNEYFGPVPRPTRTLPELHTVEPTQDGERTVVLRRVGDLQWGGIAYHVPPGAHEDMAALQILSEVLGNAPAGRLYKAIVEPGKAAGVFPAALPLHDPGMAGFFAQVRVGQPLDPVVAQLIDIVEKPGAKAITDAEVERARTQILSQIELQLNSSEQVGLALSDFSGMGDWRLMFINRDRLRNVKTADVQRVWSTYFKATNRTAAYFYPTKTQDRVEVPTAPDVVAMVKDYKGDAAKAVGEEFDATPQNIEARTQRSELPGGLELALLPKKTRGGSVFASLSLRMGDVNNLKNLGDVPAMTSEMLMRGTTKHTRQQLSDEFDKLKARVNISSWGSGVNVWMETTRENLPAVLTLVTEVLREPAFDAKELEQLRAERLAGVEQQRSEPTALGFTAYQKKMKPYPKGDIRYVDSIDEAVANIKTVTRAQLQAFHRDFYGAQPAQMAVVGDFDAPATAAQISSLLGGWKSAKAVERVPSQYFDVAGSEAVIETPDKAQAFFVAGLPLALRDDDPDYPALVLGNYMLGGGFLNSRLMVRIRQKDGLSYGVGSQINADTLDKTGSFMSYAIYAPQNLAKLQAAFNEEIARVLAEDFTAEEIEQAKSGWLQGRSVARAQDNELVGNLSHYLYIDRTLAWDAAFEDKVKALTAAQIRDALKRHLVPAKFTIIKAGDFAGAAKNVPASAPATK